MTIANYGDLKTAVANFMNRSDLTTRIPEFITLATARINYGSDEPPFQSDPLRIRAMEASDDLTISGQTVAIPARVVQVRRLYLNTNPVHAVKLVSPEIFWSTGLSGGASTPTAFTIEGENFVFGPTPDTTYTGKLLSYKTFAALSDDADTNWLLTNHPGAYLYGSQMEAADYLFDQNMKQAMHAKFVGVINALNLADKRDRYSGSAWVARGDTGNP